MASMNDILTEDGLFRICAVYAVDWTMFGEQIKLRDVPDMELLNVLVVGVIAYEDDDVLGLSQQVFDDEDHQVRFTVMIPKQCILERHEFEMGDD